MPTWTVPGYADIRELGHNGPGRTALGQHVATGVRVAIRYLPDDLRRDEEYLAGYRARARSLADLHSPHIAGMYEYVESDDGVAIVREFVEGVSLRQLVASARLEPEAALTVLNAGLLGLAAARARDTAHGAYKPENILVDRSGHTRVSDFGATPGTPDGDVAAAVATFVTSATGTGGADRLPRRLRALPRTQLTDAAALLVELEGAARATSGADWEARGRRRLAGRVDRLLRRDRNQR